MDVLLQAIASGLLIGMVYALISVGLTLIFGLMEIVNFAHGEFLMLAMYAAFWGSLLFGLDPMVSLPATVLALAALGVLTYYGIIARILKAPMLAQIFATFGLGLLLRGLAQFFWTANFRTVPDSFLAGLFGGTVRVGAVSLGVPQIAAALLAGLAFAGLYLFIRHTRTGLALQAVAEDRGTAALMGINSDRMFALGWGLGAGCVGIAGAVLASFYYIYPSVGVLFALIAYIVVALGGFGSVPGALVAGLLVGLVEVVSPTLFGFSPAYKYAVVFGLYLVVVLIRPRGLFGQF
ncbi:MAG: branched-chain amino acid ABC transporter permease [Chloroflexia bacterium]|nr:branched-chain amino acid ABC transporter permease [Chloroflexia bacterium]MDQ3410858.1 branched-chain amino acid ABC transporter permease [Chloroflexota bacterium]